MGRILKLLIVLIVSFCLAGCATTDYYVNPTSPGYTEYAWNCVCERCSGVFTISTYQYDNIPEVSCYHCGYVQDTKLARNRGIYFDQQQQANASLQAWQAFMGAAMAHSQAEQRKARNISKILEERRNKKTYKIYDGVGGIPIGTIREE